jgi:hypothetical protein
VYNRSHYPVGHGIPSSCPTGPSSPNVGEEEFYEVRGSNLPRGGGALAIGVGLCSVSGVRLATRWLHSWRGIVASGCDLLPTNFRRILGTLLRFWDWNLDFACSFAYLIADTNVMDLGLAVLKSVHIGVVHGIA